MQILKAQEDQKKVKDLLYRFIKENPQYSEEAKLIDETTNDPPMDEFSKFYYELIGQLKSNKRTVKTSLNFELSDKSQAILKRQRRIAVRVTSEMPPEKVDELLRVFNVNNNEESSSQEEIENESEEVHKLPISFARYNPEEYYDSNYIEDDEDYDEYATYNIPRTPYETRGRNSQFGSFQDLILKGWRNEFKKRLEAKGNA